MADEKHHECTFVFHTLYYRCETTCSFFILSFVFFRAPIKGCFWYQILYFFHKAVLLYSLSGTTTKKSSKEELHSKQFQEQVHREVLPGRSSVYIGALGSKRLIATARKRPNSRNKRVSNKDLQKFLPHKVKF